jgi:hypothetical protein
MRQLGDGSASWYHAMQCGIRPTRKTSIKKSSRGAAPHLQPIVIDGNFNYSSPLT